jgi:hypothetical protein
MSFITINHAKVGDIKRTRCDFDTEAVERCGIDLKFIKKQTPEICLAAVKQNGLALYYVKEQSYQICLAAVKQNGFALDFVDAVFATDEICLEAIKQNEQALQFVIDTKIENVIDVAMKQNEEVCQYLKIDHENDCFNRVWKKIVSKNGLLIRFCEHQTFHICLAAVNQNGLVLHYCKIKSFAISWAAVVQNCFAISFVKEPSNVLYQLALAQNVKSIESVDFKWKMCPIEDDPIAVRIKIGNFTTFDDCLREVSEDGHRLCLVPKKFRNRKMSEEAIENNGLALQFVDAEFHDERMCLKAVEDDGRAIEFIDEEMLNFKICFEAVKQNGKAFYFIANNLIFNKKFTRDKVYEIQYQTLMRCGEMIRFMNNPDGDLALVAVKNDPLALIYIDRQNEEICKLAASLDVKAIEFIRDQDLKMKLSKYFKIHYIPIECVICLGEEGKFVYSNCRHHFHLDCLKQWGKNKCTFCFQNFSF